MNGGRLFRRGVLVASLCMASTAAWAGVAQANDRSTAVICVDERAGDWRASMTFSSIDVRDGHPVEVSFGSDSATLTAPGPDGSATLHQDFGAGTDHASVAWSVARNGVVERSGSESFEQPSGCQAPATSEPPASEPPATQPPVTEPPTTEAPTPGSTPQGPAASTPTSAPHAGALPVTGRATALGGAVGLAVLLLGGAAVWAARRHPDELIGD